MKKISADQFFRGRYFAAAVAGLLLTCAFPNIGVAGFAWISPGLMLAAALGTRGGEAFRIGYTAGLAHFLSMLYWLLLIPYRWHGLPLGPALGWLALSGFAALFPAAWVWMMATLGVSRESEELPPSTKKASSPQPSPPKEQREKTTSLDEFTSEQGARGSVQLISDHPGLLARLATALPSNWAGRALWMLAGAAMWVALEMVRARIFGGFPWDPLGVSQHQMVPLIQVASVTGVYGVSFLIVWVSLSLLSAALMMVRRPSARSVWIAEMFIPVLVTAALFNIGFRQVNRQPAPGRNLRVMLVQPSIPQTLIWDPSRDTNRFSELVEYTAQVLTNKSDLVIWPESAVPKMLRYDTNTFNAISSLARAHKVWMIVGSDDAEPRRGFGNKDEADYFNSSFLVSPDGELVRRYIKRNLVIFGEYVPLQRWLPFLKWFTPVEGGFTAGTGPVEFHLEDLEVRTSVLICFEDVFPQLGRTDVKPDTDFLVNITNDGWFGRGAAQWQQATMALFRAVENRVPLIRCCNNGVSCWIDAAGRMRQILRDEQGTVYGIGYLRAEVPILGRGQKHALTLYTKHGDVFGWVCVAVSVAIVGRGFFSRRMLRSRQTRAAEF